ncbi:MAG: helix-turn-helix domain-containing protein [Bdellovibrionales bacterium]
MTTSRKGPAQGQSSSAASAPPSKPPTGHQNIVCDGIVSAPNEMKDQTPNNPNDVRDMGMKFKLHLTLESLLKSRNQSARQAAKACGIPLSTFSSYLKPGKRQIDPQHLLAISKHFGVSTDYLLSGQNGPTDTFKNLPTKRIFSRWVKLTLEGLELDETKTGDSADE